MFAAGFRPFFLASGAWAALAMALWLAALTGLVALPSAFDATTWHAHEMVFGFAGAAVTGYALTLIPNWTGSFPLQGWRLAVLAGLWAAGRLTVTGSAVLGAGPAMLVDLSLPALVLAASAREVVTGRNWRNLPLLGALSLLSRSVAAEAAALLPGEGARRRPRRRGARR